MAANGTVLVAGVDSCHGRAYTLALVSGGYRVKALVAEAPTSETPTGTTPEGQARQASRTPWTARLGVVPAGADLNDASSVRRRIKGADAVFIALASRDAGGRVAEERATRALIEAAAAEGVPIVYSSLLHADQLTGVPALDLKGRLELVARRSGVPVTILRPGLLMDVFDDTDRRERATRDGSLTSAIALDAPVSYLAVDDLGLLAVLALEVFGDRGATLNLGGPQAVTFADLLPQLWRMMGHSVTYRQLSPHEARASFSGDEVPLVQHINGTGYVVDMQPLLERLPVRLTTLAEYLTARGWGMQEARVAA